MIKNFVTKVKNNLSETTSDEQGLAGSAETVLLVIISVAIVAAIGYVVFKYLISPQSESLQDQAKRNKECSEDITKCKGFDPPK